MSDKTLKNRDQMDKAYFWNIEAMFADDGEIDPILEDVQKKAEEFKGFAGKLTESAKTLCNAFQKRDALRQQLGKVYTYASMRRDEDNRVAKYQAMVNKCQTMFAQISAALSFFTPELLDAPKETLMAYIQEEKGLQVYAFAIGDILRQKKHVLTKAEENILAQMSEITGAPDDIFTMLTDADLKFGQITDEDGDKVELTHGNYITFLQSYNREVRKEAYDCMYVAFKGMINTLATTYNYNTRTDVITAKIRKYDSARQASLAGENIPEAVYDNLIEVVNQNLPAFHRYIKLRKKILDLEKLQMYDVYVPLVELPKKKIPYSEAISIVKEGLSPLGEEYTKRMEEGIAAGWIDVYENQGKTSGAYSFGSYDSMPYILLNYTDTLRDVFTLAHELGHSMHSSYTRQAQPYIYGGHSIFTAEVASTVNESLLINHLLKHETDPSIKKYLLNLYIEEFQTTIFRQTMFAEFERLTHREIEEGRTLTAEWMCEEYKKLNTKYFGSAMGEDDLICHEWARIPHFYSAFYVYQYATGYSAAAAISQKIIEEGAPAAETYINFLKTGESDFPIELLKLAGVDMSSPVPIEKAMETFKTLVDEFEALV